MSCQCFECVGHLEDGPTNMSDIITAACAITKKYLKPGLLPFSVDGDVLCLELDPTRVCSEDHDTLLSLGFKLDCLEYPVYTIREW